MTRALVAAVLSATTATGLVAACAGGEAPPGTAPDGGQGSTTRDAAGRTANEDDAGADASDSAAPCTSLDGPGEAGASCTLNRDCNADLRCECDEIECSCAPGKRGCGAIGSLCDEAHDCASSLCVEGPKNTGAHYCSEECVTAADCKDPLPRCIEVSYIGRICARNP